MAGDRSKLWATTIGAGFVAAALVLQYLSFVSEQPALVLPPVARLARGADWIGSPRAGLSVAGTLIASAVVAILVGQRRGSAAGGAKSLAWQIAGAHSWALALLGHEALMLGTAGKLADSTALAEMLWLAAVLTATLVPAGWLWSLWQIASPPADEARRSLVWLCAAVAIYAGVFSTLSILQYQALHVPHGDTGMYEEHLWNLLHGKGFRSQLDDGRLFLGEHLQVVHLLLLPIYLLYPTLPTLNVCQSAALASGAVAVWWIARRCSLTPRIATTLAIGYLLYFPMQHLNLEASWKTFRPTSFGTVALLFALAALEAHRYRLLLVLFVVVLLVQEECAIAVGAVGVYLMLRQARGPLGRREALLGLGIATAAALYLVGVLGWFIPYFRGGAPHYTPYFASLGESPGEIVRTLLANPRATLGRMTEPADLRFIVLMLLPVGFLPLASPLRLATTLPVFGYLLLGEREGMNQPWFHFHAPLTALVWWSAVGGMAKVARVANPTSASRLVVLLALVSGFWFGRSPLSWRFYDPAEGVPRKPSPDGMLFEPTGSYFRDVYFQTPRSRAFAAALATIRTDERVAATDYLRNRFTHHRAAHDYPTLRGHVTIDDIDVIVIDKTEGWWGRGPTNPDRQLLACLADPDCLPGRLITVRKRPFAVIYHDEYFLVVRRQ